MALTVNGKNKGQNCYVYYHKDGDEIIYVGKGTGGRCLEFRDRKPDHKEWMLRNLPHRHNECLEIVSSGMSADLAEGVENLLIQKYQPRFNLKGKDGYEYRQLTEGRITAQQAVKGSLWWTDGIHEKRSAVKPGPTWSRGRANRRQK